MKIRTATRNDLPALIDIGQDMHAESRYRAYTYDPDRLEQTLKIVLDDELSLVAEAEDGRIVGAFIAFVTPQFFGSDLMSSDLALYIVPEFRQGRLALRLLTEYICRARERGVTDIRVGNSTDVESERVGRLYESLGFRRVGGLYAMEG